MYISFPQTTNAAGVPITDKTCLIMDEVDGMSAGDRGGVGALNSLIKKTKVSRYQLVDLLTRYLHIWSRFPLSASRTIEAHRS